MNQANTFYLRRGKRLFDVFCSVLALLLLSPLLALIGLAIKYSSPGGALFWQERVGRRGKVFRICKFRTMVAGADRLGPGITSEGDPRITRIGVLLRLWKLDELPQLWNVLTGDMSLVGPRPELPSYVGNYTEAQRHVLSVRPGITDPASIRYRNEERLLSGEADQELFYTKVLLPQKLDLNLEYVEKLSFRSDIGFILKTLRVLPAHGDIVRR